MTQFAKETLPISLEEEMRRSYLDYAMSVIVGRALPDARDGLKPVHRRVLFAMHELNNDWNRPYKKSARIVGDVIGKYHPHGDSAVYDTIVRMAQDFSLRHMLVDGQGNFGSVDGDNAAAMRYTEIRLAKIAHEMLADIDKETVDFGPNYDGSEREPLVLPTRLPNLLVNGSTGIAVGMATNIPPHNLNEVVDACLHALRNPEVTIDELMEIIPAPDFPTAGIIYGLTGARDGYRTGRGKVVMRAKVHFEDIDRGQRQSIIVDEIPYQVNKKTLLERMAMKVSQRLKAPNWSHWSGTDELGRDITSRIFYGARYSLAIGAGTAVLAAFFGTLMGLLAGFFKSLDAVLMRLVDAMMAFPDILLGIALVSILDASPVNVVLALTLVYTPRVARVVRASTLVIRELPYIEAAQAVGLSTPRLLVNHILPNLMSPILVQLSFIFAYALLAEAGLSFLGVGVGAEIPTWGTMVASSTQYADRALWTLVFPGLAIVLTALSLQVLGDGVRDLLDPRLKGSV
jgi:ABC-type dipeptide/oligopeptide/nickel transport system permease subunit